MDNGSLMKELLCGLVTGEKKEILKMLIECFEKKDNKVEKHECHAAVWNKLKSYPDAMKAMTEMAG